MPGGGLGAGDLELKTLTYDYSTYTVLKRTGREIQVILECSERPPEVLKDARGATVDGCNGQELMGEH